MKRKDLNRSRAFQQGQRGRWHSAAAPASQPAAAACPPVRSFAATVQFRGGLHGSPPRLLSSRHERAPFRYLPDVRQHASGGLSPSCRADPSAGRPAFFVGLQRTLVLRGGTGYNGNKWCKTTDSRGWRRSARRFPTEGAPTYGRDDTVGRQKRNKTGNKEWIKTPVSSALSAGKGPEGRVR